MTAQAVAARPNPFADHPLRRYAFAWQALAGRGGRHLDVGCGDGAFLETLAATSALRCYGADPHPGYLAALRRRWPAAAVQRISVRGPLGFRDGAFDSASLLDVLEHAEDEDALLAEVHRVLAPGGLLVVTVPARHALSFLDPDNAKFRAPRLHRLVYSARFGADTYRRRFVDLSDGLRGDCSAGRGEHTNYRPAELVARLRAAGFQVVERGGANLLWRLFQVPGLLAGPRLRALLDRAILADGRRFASANLFLVARRIP
ncbi:MAG TPA: methyltransferase domain-containing protein [Actinomycetes bacterium]|jgi:SAM-dependent methyltransferase|nr:methyltransferase domain-containing protein [Actinomycetes bacterium]